jgi:hypothetical protein
MRKLTSVLAAVAVGVTLALPAAAMAETRTDGPQVSHRDGPHGCKKNRANPSHKNGPGCGKNRRRGNLSHRRRG